MMSLLRSVGAADSGFTEVGLIDGRNHCDWKNSFTWLCCGL